jgi:multidrug efflux pump subunit AcrA (membrane-fusion protein)
MNRLVGWVWTTGCLAATEVLPSHPNLQDRITFQAVETATDVPIATLPAQVVPAPGTEVWLSPPSDGRLSEWTVRPGQSVAVGDPIGTLTSATLAADEGEIATLEAAVAQARGRALAAKAAADRGVAPAVLAEDLSNEAAWREAQLRSARIRAAGVRDGGSGGGTSWTWRATSSGIVDEVRCTPGPVRAGEPCLSVVEPRAVRVVVQLPERLDRPGRTPTHGTLTTPGGHTAALTLEFQDPALDARTRSRSLVFVAEPSPPLGASGRAELRIQADSGIFRVPALALTRAVEGPGVWVPASGELPARFQAVQEVGRDADWAYVSGLEPGTEVAVRGVFLLKSLALAGAEVEEAH